MNRITVSNNDCNQETTSAWLASIEGDIPQLEHIHHELFIKHNLSTASHKDVVVDIDI